MIAVLPNTFTISDADRHQYLDQMQRSAERYSHHHINFVWLQADDHPEFEKAFDLGFDLPALVVVNAKKRAFGRPDGRFGKDTINRYFPVPQ